MPKPFHNFFSASAKEESKVFYSGTLNALIKDLLLQNVLDIIQEYQASDKVLYDVSSECLDKLSDVLKHEKEKPAVLFNLSKSPGSWELSLGVPVKKDDVSELKKLMVKLMMKPTVEGRKQFIKYLSDVHHGERIVQILPLISIAVRKNKKFNFCFDSLNEVDHLLSLKFELEAEHE